MPPSQLKRLKASLRQQGILGPQQTKKQKKKNYHNGTGKQTNISRGVALAEIREQCNPFEFKELSKKPKFESTTLHNPQGIRKRPGLVKSHEEAASREAYFEELRHRKKVGGIIDKRFGENDPTLAPEEKMLERFTREKMLRHKKSSAFDLEDNDLPGELTHMGNSLSLDGPAIVDDFLEEDLELSDNENALPHERRSLLKRTRSEYGYEADYVDEDIERPERKKSKHEVMKELIAKSKLHRYERQAVKDDDQDLRELLDKETSIIHRLLQEIPSKTSTIHDLAGSVNKVKVDKEYDIRLRQLALDKRSQPTEKSKTEDEVAVERARKLQELESRRLRRMRGSPMESDHDTNKEIEKAEMDEEDEDFGFGAGIKVRPTNLELDVEDEDDFFIEHELLASGSGIENSVTEASHSEAEDDVDDPDSVSDTGMLTEEETNRPEFLTGANSLLAEEIPTDNGIDGDLAYHFSCPQSHEEFLETTCKINTEDLGKVVQRVRILYDPKLKSENKSRLSNFSVALVDHVFYLANQTPHPSFAIIETLIRHIHSLAKSFPLEISNAFRRHLKNLDASRAMSPTPGDLVLLTAIGIIFPTSDHFHQVVTLAILSMGRYLGLKVPQHLHELVIGTYLSTLCLFYQRISKRFIPEIVNFAQNSLCVLAPTEIEQLPGNFPYHVPKSSFRLDGIAKSAKRLNFYDCLPQDLSDGKPESIKASLIGANLNILGAAVDIWVGNLAFIEVFQPTLKLLRHMSGGDCREYLPESTQIIISKLTEKLLLLLSQAKISRRPLELHHHRPKAIKTSLPKFEESFNPERHYDPDKTRTEVAKLKKEHKREKKGAIRELRKEARLLAVQSLKDKRERDAAYEKKYKRLVAEIQGEEGREAKAYEREKETRKKSRK